MKLTMSQTLPCRSCAQDFAVPSEDGYGQVVLARQFGVDVEVAHRALADVQTLAAIWPHLLAAASASLDDIIASTSRCVGLVSDIVDGGTPSPWQRHVRLCLSGAIVLNRPQDLHSQALK